MKKLSSLIIVVIVLALIYTGFWFYNAHHVKELFLYHLKEYEKPNAEGYHVKVDDVTVHGYPFNYEIKLTNPRYENASESKDSQQSLKVAVDGAIKIGTDIFGRSYWIKKEGDVNYTTNSTAEESAKKYTVKDHLEFEVAVAHPQYARAFIHPFFGLPKVFYKENPSFTEVLNELKMANYEDRDFKLYEVDNNAMKPLASFPQASIRWKHSPDGNDRDKFVFNLELKDLEATEGGKFLLPHLKKWMANPDLAVNDVPYFANSGKNNISIEFEATLPRNFEILNFFSYKNLNIELKKLDSNNEYGQTSITFDVSLKEQETDSKNLHMSFNTESLITEKGSEAIHRHFIESLKQTVSNQPADPTNKALLELLKCCEDKLQDIIPNYSRLGKMQFVFDADVKVKNISQNPALDKMIISHFDLLSQPYGIKSHGMAELTDSQLHGKYEINWINYKEMIHDLVDYFNRIHPIYEKFAETNKQPVSIGLISDAQEKEIADFFKSISDESSKDNATITITLDYSDANNPKIGNNSMEQVRAAWEKLVGDIMKQPETKPAKPSEPTKT